MQAKEKAEALKRQKDYLKNVTQAQKTSWTAFTFIALLLLVFFGTAGAPNPGGYPFLMFVGLVAAGATGALVRSVIWAPDEMTPIRSLVLGGIAGFVVGAAYLVPQFLARLTFSLASQLKSYGRPRYSLFLLSWLPFLLVSDSTRFSRG